MIVLRLLYIASLFLLFYFFIRSCFSFKKKGSKIKSISSFVLLCLLCFWGMGDHTRYANVNEESLENVSKYLSTIDSGYYEFEIKNISGDVTVMNYVPFINQYDEFFGESKTKSGTTENGGIYTLTPVVACHHEQILYMYYPTAATGEIYLSVNGKYLCVSYYYTDGNPLGFLWGIIAPDYFYCREINVDEILNNMVEVDDYYYDDADDLNEDSESNNKLELSVYDLHKFN